MPKLLLSDLKGKVAFDNCLKATGMRGGRIFKLESSDIIRLPAGSKLFLLPSRPAIGFDPAQGRFLAAKGAFAVAAFLAPGYTATYSTAYSETGRPRQLPLFSYAAACIYKGEIHVTAVHIDKDRRHDCRYIDISSVRKNAAIFAKLFPKNRLVAHLKTCALIYGCPNAQNFFLSRYEAPLPTSPSCNASCSGCISFQPGKRCPVSQPRIKFIPTAEEVSEMALFHIERVKRPIVSFGQGCEGEPLLQDKLIERSITLIRKNTPKGTIHMNSNGSMPVALARLFDAGLDSVRISLNSAQEAYYMRYYKPIGYAFKDVIDSIKIAKRKGAFVSINYLTMPGFTDRRDEFEAFKCLVSKYKFDMVQWRNLNYDPLRYFEELKLDKDDEELVGIRNVINSLEKKFPHLRMGYFNPVLPR